MSAMFTRKCAASWLGTAERAAGADLHLTQSETAGGPGCSCGGTANGALMHLQRGAKADVLPCFASREDCRKCGENQRRESTGAIGRTSFVCATASVATKGCVRGDESSRGI